MDVVIGPLFWLLDTVIGIYIWVLIAGAVLSWLVAFNVVNTRNRFVYLIGDFLHRITEPALRPIRRVLPSLGGVDLSPLALILLLLFLRQVLSRLFIAYATGGV
jgi:YggT family protein